MSLEFITSEALMAELMTRFEHAVIIGIVPRTDDNEIVWRQATGDPFVIAGMCSDMQHRAIQSLMDQDN